MENSFINTVNLIEKLAQNFDGNSLSLKLINYAL